MSVLIKDIDMPKYGELNITIDALGGVAYTDRDMKAHDVIEVPTPHGNLIDLGEIGRLACIEHDNLSLSMIADLPIAIESEG